MLSGTAILENSLAVSYKTKPTSTIWSSNCNPGCLSQGSENLCSHKNLYLNVYSSFIRHSQKLEIIQMSFNRWMVKLWHSAIKKNQLLTHAVTWMNLQGIMWSEKRLIPQSCILYDSTYIPFLKWQDYRNGEQVSSSSGLGEGGAMKWVGTKAQQEGSLCWWKCSASRGYCCQYPGCDLNYILLQVFPWGGNWVKDTRDLYYFLQLDVNLQLSKIKVKVFKVQHLLFHHSLSRKSHAENQKGRTVWWGEGTHLLSLPLYPPHHSGSISAELLGQPWARWSLSPFPTWPSVVLSLALAGREISPATGEYQEGLLVRSLGGWDPFSAQRHGQGMGLGTAEWAPITSADAGQADNQKWALLWPSLG